MPDTVDNLHIAFDKIGNKFKKLKSVIDEFPDGSIRFIYVKNSGWHLEFNADYFL
jgi:hypothetical protein